MLMLFQNSRSDDAGAALLFLLMILFWIASIALYFLPTVVALWRHHPQIGPIIVIDFLFGWSIVGWIVAMAWSVSHINRPPRPPNYSEQQPHPEPNYNYKRI